MKRKRLILPIPKHDRSVIIMADTDTNEPAPLSLLICFERNPGPGRRWKHCTYRRPFNSPRVRQLHDLLWKATCWQLADTRPCLGPIGYHTNIRTGARIFSEFDTCEKEND